METRKNHYNGTLPAAPLTLDGAYILHQMFRLRWSDWRALGASDQKPSLEGDDHVSPAWKKIQ